MRVHMKILLIILIYLVSLGNSTNLEKLNIKDDGLIYKKKKLYTGQVFIDVKAPIIEGNQLNFYFLKKITKVLKKEIKNKNINLVSKGKKVGKWFEYSPNYIFQYNSNYVDGVREVINIEKNSYYDDYASVNSEIYKYLDLLNEIELIIPGYADIIYTEQLIGKTVVNDLNMYFFNKIRNFELNKTNRGIFIHHALKYLKSGQIEPSIQSIQFSPQTNYYEDAHNGKLFALSNNSALGITEKWSLHKSKDFSSLVLFKSVGLRGKEKNQINFHRYAMIDQNDIYIDSINYFIDKNKLEPYRDDYYKVSVLDSVTYFDLLLKSSYIKPYENKALFLLGDTTIASNNGIIEIKKDGKKFMELIQYNKSNKKHGIWSNLYQQRYYSYLNGLHLKTFMNENQNFEIKIKESLINYNNLSYEDRWNTEKLWGSDRFVVEFPSKNQTYDYKTNDNKIKFSVKNTIISEVNFKNNKIKLIQDNSGKAIISSINAYHFFKSPIENIRIKGINGSFKNKKFSGEIIFNYLLGAKYDTTTMYLAKYKNNIFDDTYFNSGSYKFEKKGNDYYVTDYWISEKEKMNFKDYWKSENKVKYFEGTYSEMELNEYSVNEWGEKKIKKTFTEWLPQGYKQYYDKENKTKKLSIFFDETGLPIEKKSICFDENGEVTTCKTKTVFVDKWYSLHHNRYVTEFKRGPSYSDYYLGDPGWRIDHCKEVEDLLKNFDDFNQYLMDEALHMIGEYYSHKFLKEKLSHQTLKSVDLIFESKP